MTSENFTTLNKTRVCEFLCKFLYVSVLSVFIELQNLFSNENWTTTVVRNYWHNFEKRYRFGSHKIENSLQRPYGEVEDNIIIYI